MNRLLLIIIPALFSLVSCEKQEAEEINLKALKKEEPKVFRQPEKLIAYVDNEDNDFIKTKHIGEITYQAALRPVDYLLSKKRIQENNPSLRKEAFEDLQYFDLRIGVADFHQEFIKYNLASGDDYQQQVNYCSFNMQKDIKLIDGKDTLNCVLFHYERTFDVVPYGHFTLGFEPIKSALVNTKVLLFSDQLFKNGMIKFTFSPKLLVNEPTLL